MTGPRDLLRTAYGDLTELLHAVARDGGGWAPTGCRGTGREALDDADRTELGAASEAFPLFG